VIQGFVQSNLFRHGKLATTAACIIQTEPAPVIRTPLTAGAVLAGVFFRRVIRHQQAALFMIVLLPAGWILRLKRKTAEEMMRNMDKQPFKVNPSR
jgi:hypothetical protein